MKRLLGSIFVLLGLLILTAPLGAALDGASRSVTISTHEALAGTPAPSPKNDGVNLTNPSGCVKIALPILNGGSSCVANNNASGGAIIVYLREVLTLLGAAVGLVIVLMMIIAGIQYITSAGDAGRVKSAKDRIVGAITALVLFMFMVAILQFLVPGGIL